MYNEHDGNILSHAHPHGHVQANSQTSDKNTGANGDTTARNAALLHYLLEHNRIHTNELVQVSDRMRSGGRADVADMINVAVLHFEHGNEELEKAINLL